LKDLKAIICGKFKILVLVDLGNTIFYRANIQHSEFQKQTPWPKKWTNVKDRNKLYWLRPGYFDFVKRLQSHPRCAFGFYTSITGGNAYPIIHRILTKELYNNVVRLFDQSHCTFMSKDAELERLIEEPWDTYRDLDKVFKDYFCEKNKFNYANTLVVDSDARKV
jgi:hypothetical protein